VKRLERQHDPEPGDPLALRSLHDNELSLAIRLVKASIAGGDVRAVEAELSHRPPQDRDGF
jgi:hypothetical protein